MALVRPQAVWVNELSKHLLETREHLHQLDPSDQAAVCALLDQCQCLIDSRPPLKSGPRLVQWWTGSRIEHAWALLHQADLELVDHAPSGLLGELLEVALQHGAILPADDPARIRLSKAVEALSAPISRAADVD